MIDYKGLFKYTSYRGNSDVDTFIKVIRDSIGHSLYHDKTNVLVSLGYFFIKDTNSIHVEAVRVELALRLFGFKVTYIDLETNPLMRIEWE